MTRLLEYLLIALGLWTVLSPFVLGCEEMYGTVVVAVIGIAGIALAALGFTSKTIQWNFALLAVLGLALALWGLVGGLLLQAASPANDVIIGLLICAVSVACLPFQVDAKKATFYNRSGQELARIEKISDKKGNLLAKSVLLASMPETIFIRPEELCRMLALIDFAVVKKLPGLLYAGWKVNREEREKKPE